MNRNFLSIERLFKTVSVNVSAPVLAGRQVRNLGTPANNGKLLNSVQVCVVYRRSLSQQWYRHFTSSNGTRELTCLSKELKFGAFNNAVLHNPEGTWILTGGTEQRKFGVFSNSVLHKCSVRHYCSDLNSEDAVNGNNNIGDELLKDSEYTECMKKYCSLPDAGHRVFILQIVGHGAGGQNKSTGDLQLSENIALVQAIPRWTVVDSEIVHVNYEKNTKQVISRFHAVAKKICSSPGVSAVFVSRNMLSAEEILAGCKIWQRPVFDRTFIVTQVFKAQAQSREARLHVALAELPYLRFCMSHGLDQGWYGNRDVRYISWPFKDREKKLKVALATLQRQRTQIRDRRTRRQIPTIAVIGYTNSGKTTLIKALTGDEDMTPHNKLFATVDVTAHGGLLPNRMTVVYMDTVGFLSDLPHHLKGAFTATLEDTTNADLVVHVRDISHPDTDAQRYNVIQSIQTVLPKDKLASMIEVCNKVDRIAQSDRCLENPASSGDQRVFYVSAVTGEGMEELRQEIQSRLLHNIDFLQKKLKIPQNGPHLRWLHDEATVVSCDADDADPESLIVDIYISEANYRKFLARFGAQQKTAANR